MIHVLLQGGKAPFAPLVPTPLKLSIELIEFLEWYVKLGQTSKYSSIAPSVLP